MEEFDLFSSLPENGLTYVDSLLAEDVRNNSAWSHRHFIIIHTTGFTEAIIESELAMSLERLRLTPGNESAWNYVRG